MAPRRSEWSCPLCTLLNSWRDRRCAACDHEREEDPASAAADGSAEVPTAQQRQAELERDYATAAAATAATAQEPIRRPANWQPAGVFFCAPATAPGNATAWRQEPRLQVNRGAARVRAQESMPSYSLLPIHEVQPPQGNKHVIKQQQESYRDVQQQQGIYEEVLPQGNCHDQMRLPPPPPSPSPVQEMPTYGEQYPSPDYGLEPSRTQELEDAETQMPEAPSFSLLGDFTAVPAVSSSPPSWNIMGQINTSDTIQSAVEDDGTKSKLAQAGLDLSDSDEDTQPKRRHLRRLSDTGYDEPEDNPSSVGGQQWECHVCTESNSARVTECELCGTRREMDNAQQSERRDHFIDLVDSDNDAPARYGQIDDDDFENPYAPVRPTSPMYDDEYGAAPADTTTGYDSVEDISDNEPQILESRPPTSSRPDLRQFENFICVEDIKGDYGSKIDYQNMFGEVKRGKSYDDRLLKRRRESQKRKRQAQNGVPLEPAKGKKRAAASSKGKKKSKPGFKRASTSKAATSKAATAKRQKATGTSNTRRSSAPSYSSGINHYDTASADFGEDLTTMAWEGVGSAGYF